MITRASRRPSPGLTIVRACATQPAHTLEGWQRGVYVACKEALSEAHVQALAEESGATGAEFESFVAALVESRLAVKLDGRLLALATEVSPRDADPSSAAAGLAAAG